MFGGAIVAMHERRRQQNEHVIPVDDHVVSVGTWAVGENDFDQQGGKGWKLDR